MKNKFIYLKPDYYDEFSCIGPDCRSNCCSYPWQIDIDKATYKKYNNKKAINNKELFENMKKYIKKNDCTNSNNYATMELLTNPLRCAFQTDEGLCKIHRDLGENYLSNTCKMYPRAYSLCAENIMEHSLSCSCEALVKMLLDKKTPIIFKTQEEDITVNQFQNKFPVFLNNIKAEKTSVKFYYLNIKTVCIAILQNRSYDIEERLCILVYFLNKIHTLEIENKADECIPFINAFVDMLSKGRFDYFDGVDVNLEKQFNFLFLFTSYYFSMKAEEDLYFIKQINNVYGDFSLCELENGLVKMPEDAFNNYKVDIDKYYKFMDDKKEFIENILVSELHSKCMPFQNEFNIIENAMSLVIYYSIMKVVISSYLHNKDDITDQEIIDIYSYYSKICLHSIEPLKKAIKFMHANEASSLIEIIRLIKRKN